MVRISHDFDFFIRSNLRQSEQQSRPPSRSPTPNDGNRRCPSNQSILCTLGSVQFPLNLLFVIINLLDWNLPRRWVLERTNASSLGSMGSKRSGRTVGSQRVRRRHPLIVPKGGHRGELWGPHLVEQCCCYCSPTTPSMLRFTRCTCCLDQVSGFALERTRGKENFFI